MQQYRDEWTVMYRCQWTLAEVKRRCSPPSFRRAETSSLSAPGSKGGGLSPVRSIFTCTHARAHLLRPTVSINYTLSTHLWQPRNADQLKLCRRLSAIPKPRCAVQSALDLSNKGPPAHPVEDICHIPSAKVKDSIPNKLPELSYSSRHCHTRWKAP